MLVLEKPVSTVTRGGILMSMPKWLKPVVKSVCESCVCDAKGRMSEFSIRYSRPSETAWGVWLVDVALAPVELVGGANDGEAVFDPVDVDLLSLPGTLDNIVVCAYHPATPGEGAHFVLEGRKANREVVIRIWLEPFEDDEPTVVYDVCEGCWRPRRR
jgi:hypothetical protein